MEEGESLTALIKAAKNGQRDLVHALLDISNVDIEQTGTVKVDHETINGATALWTAVCYGHFDIVKLLIKFAANVNHTTDSGSTPLRVACYNGSLTFVDYLMEHDAGCNIANSNQQTCLMLACQKGYYDIVQYLVEKGADTKCKDKIGSTALHFSAALGQFAITKLLIEKGSMMTKDNKGLTPLMVAASNGKVEIVEYLSPLSECSREENIDVLELLGASFLLKTDFDILKVYQYFEQAMQERYKDPDEIIFKRHASQALTIINIVECKTLDDLQKIRDDELALRMEALAIAERTLGTKNNFFFDSLFELGRVLADSGDYDKCIDLWLYGSKTCHDIDVRFNVECFSEVFVEMFDDGTNINFLSLLESFHCAVTELKLDGNLILKDEANNSEARDYFKSASVACMYLIGIMLLTYKSKEEESQLYRAVYNFIQQNTYHDNGVTPLHMSCDTATNDTNTDENNVVLFPNALICKTLVACGGYVNAQDKDKNTPLHMIAECADTDCDTLREIIMCLIENGAHIDACNKDSKTAIDVAATDIAKDVIKAHTKLSLKCLSARAVRRHKVEYRDIIPVSLQTIVELH